MGRPLAEQGLAPSEQNPAGMGTTTASSSQGESPPRPTPSSSSQGETPPRPPSLAVLGLGLRCPHHTSQRCLELLRSCDQLLMISDQVDKLDWLSQINPRVTSLMGYYGAGKPRRQTYQEMADHVLGCLGQGQSVGLVSYGHPLVFCDPSRLAIEETTRQGYAVQIVPAISSIDCLLADLAVDTQNFGLQIYEGHDLLLHDLVLDPQSSQIIFQVPSLGDSGGGWKPGRYRGFIRALAEQLAQVFGWDHEVVLYFGSNSPDRPTQADRVRLEMLDQAPMLSEYTLWVPPLGYRSLPPDLRPREQPVDLELVGYGPHWDDRSSEVEELLQSPIPCRHAQELEGPEQLNDHGPQVLLFPGHPCQSGAVAWARAALAQGLSYRIRPAISWEDLCYCHVPLDPGLLGFQSFPPGHLHPDPQSLRLSTLLRLPLASDQELATQGWRAWGPQEGFSPQLQADSLAWYQDGPSPRPLDNRPFQRALHLSAVERLLALLENPPSPLELDPLRHPKIWLNVHLQKCGRLLRHWVQEEKLIDEDWTDRLLKDPHHPMAAYLLLKLRCQEALHAHSQGLSLAPLQAWLKQGDHD